MKKEQHEVAIGDWPPDPNTADTVAELAYSQADAMLRAREA